MNTIQFMNYAVSYLSKQNNSDQKWYRFFTEDLQQDFKPLKYVRKMSTPAQISSFTESEKEHFYYLFSQFNCEALIVFEQCLMLASRTLKNSLQNESEKKALLHFVREEFLHTRAFKRYLGTESVYNYPQNSLVVHRCHRLKNIFAWILKKDPMAIIVPGLKSETYSLFYTKLLCRYPEIKESTFSKLNQLHSEDETAHVQFDYDFVESVYDRRSLVGKIKFFAATYLMIFFIQFIVLLGFQRIIKNIRPRITRLGGLFLLIKIFRWVLWNFQPYIQTKRNLKSLFKQRKHRLYKILSPGTL